MAAPIIAAFLLQISFYLVPGFPEVRRQLERRWPPARLGTLLVAASLFPYLLYSLLTSVFRFQALALLLAVCAVPVAVFVLRPVRRRGLTWQDLVAGGAIAAAVLSRAFQHIYASPIAGLRLDAMGRIMIFALGAIAFLSLRRLEGSGFHFRPSPAEWSAGCKQFVLFLPIGLATGWGLGVLRFGEPAGGTWSWWMYPPAALGTFVAMYAFVAMFEEFFFRGVLQNLAATSLGHAIASQVLASTLFGLSHLWFRDFPNWRFALLSALAGWFYGQAYRRAGSVVASGIAHALTNTTWRFLFAG